MRGGSSRNRGAHTAHAQRMAALAADLLPCVSWMVELLGAGRMRRRAPMGRREGRPPGIERRLPRLLAGAAPRAQHRSPPDAPVAGGAAVLLMLSVLSALSSS